MGFYSLKDDAMPVFLLEIFDTKTIYNCQKMTVKTTAFWIVAGRQKQNKIDNLM